MNMLKSEQNQMVIVGLKMWMHLLRSTMETPVLGKQTNFSWVMNKLRRKPSCLRRRNPELQWMLAAGGTLIRLQILM
ncbi:hypothetical protein PF010_g32179 [Phytophthora fragariae]|uniref:Uncharacterized protein n=2 Tax=Phytophthora TaxID=4783 RepID=A0A6A3DFB5_9STRA|nr:hypothetical protein PF009_g32500 [Phytophthora fragariae]KAE8989738.1 hypothetical protein PR002_g21361 [Phytophthora rubi]KAE9055364.1 hypothetical protein PF010_g32179 [Phytophthora fragariae]KAE9056957.1 hypothetical protein PF007_g31811 [Phytophthora fragariae]KAE9160414.1 hypothetical protein PF002_g32624 [Phytophthora fragariae]